MQDVEEDPELRNLIDLYKNDEPLKSDAKTDAKKQGGKNKKAKITAKPSEEDDDEESVEEDFPHIKEEDLKTIEA